MMNKKTSYKRIVSLVLTVFMVASLLSVSAMTLENTKIYVNGTLVQNGDKFEADSVTVKIDPVESEDVVEVNNKAVALDENGEFVIYTSAAEATDTTDTPDSVTADGEVTITVVHLNEVTDAVTITVTAPAEEEETKDTADTSDESETKDTADETDTDAETKDTADESDTDAETKDTADESDTDAETKDTADESDTDAETKDTADESDTDGKETKDTADESDTDGKETKDTADETDTDGKETKDTADETDTDTSDQPKTEKYLNGDVDFDKFITSNDAVLILRRSADLEVFDNVQSVVGDVTGNGVFSDDALIVLRASVGLDTINPEYVDVVIG